MRNIEVSVVAPKSFFDAASDRTKKLIDRASSPLNIAVTEPTTRFQIEALQSQIRSLQTLLRWTLALELRVTLSFNSLDDD